VVTIDKEIIEIVAGPDLVSRGFVYVRESEELMEDAREKVREALEVCMKKGLTEWAMIKAQVREKLSRHLYEKTGRKPMILPIIMEI
jgi:ribonuclease J